MFTGPLFGRLGLLGLRFLSTGMVQRFRSSFMHPLRYRLVLLVCWEFAVHHLRRWLLRRFVRRLKLRTVHIGVVQRRGREHMYGMRHQGLRSFIGAV